VRPRPVPSAPRRSVAGRVADEQRRTARLCGPPNTVNREIALHFALGSDDNVAVGIIGGDIVVRRGGWLAWPWRASATTNVAIDFAAEVPAVPAGDDELGGRRIGPIAWTADGE